jgi:hypothetical protein
LMEMPAGRDTFVRRPTGAVDLQFDMLGRRICPVGRACHRCKPRARRRHSKCGLPVTGMFYTASLPGRHRLEPV